MIAKPPETLMRGPNERIFAYLRGKSAHSDIVEPLWHAVKDLPGVTVYCADTANYGYVVVSAGERIVAFAEGAQGITLRVSANTFSSLMSRGAQARPDIGEGWVFLPLFCKGGLEAEVGSLAKEAVASVAPPSNNSLQARRVSSPENVDTLG